ncbi:superoxide dismutase [Fe] [Marinicella sp. S1101]|uniref:superoxide dismutase n=1 Tax=Marinicella marina TaxID=2996016 RepID=UPI002260F959|nr:Fe-Mn family superoxide dismutase [Marinicella marina]MCX7554889.1 superoxide dismutase [Fe] [Marinicella marina]MDJ1141287.1 Fe-Mn family superoxide dismutase [Marinicella marina]
MSFELPELPYEKNALEPHISAETLEYHHGKHHNAYVNNLNGMIKDTEFEGLSLEDIIKKSDGGVFNNAAQIWNHTFYFNGFSPDGGGQPSGDLAEKINATFGSFDAFVEKFNQTAMTTFGSGWAWLVQNEAGDLEVVSTSNAGNPITDGKHPLLTCDVWEHAYYVDTRNDRGGYLKNFWNIVNWDYVAGNLK